MFDRKHKADRTHKGLVQVEILFMRRRKWIGTGIHLYKHQWDDKRHVTNSPTLIQDNETLDAIMAHVKEIVHGIIKETGDFSFQLYERRAGRVRLRENFLDYVRKDAIKERSKSRMGQYLSVYSHLCDFNKIFTFEDLSTSIIEEFDEHLSECGLKASTIRNYHSILKAILKKAIKAGYLHENPYDDFEMPESDSDPRAYLTKEELDRFVNTDVPERWQVSKDFFIVQSYTGLSFSDLKRFSKSCTEKRGNKIVVIGNRIKTGVDYYIVLMKRVIDILEKYDYKLPCGTLKTVNEHLKKIAVQAKINKEITTHIGRHTFAVLALSNGMKIEMVSKILGHKDIKTTQIYAKIVDSAVEDSFEKLELVL